MVSVTLKTKPSINCIKRKNVHMDCFILKCKFLCFNNKTNLLNQYCLHQLLWREQRLFLASHLS